MWIFVAILPPFFWAISNLIDENLIRHRLRHPLAILSFSGIAAIIPVSVIILFAQWSLPNLEWCLLGLITGIVGLSGYYPYFRALESMHPATMQIWWNASPVLVTLGAFFFLGERLSLMHYAAIFLILSSVLLIGFVSHPTRRKKIATPAIIWMMIAIAVSATEAILGKILFTHVSFESGLLLVGVGNILGGLAGLSIRKVRYVLKRTIRLGGIKELSLSEGMDLLGMTTNYYAVSIGSVSLVKAVGGLQPIFVLFLGWIVHRYFKQRLRLEVRDAPPLFFCVTASLLAIVGLLFLTENL